MQLKSPAAITEQAFETGLKKTQTTGLRLLTLSILAGCYISLGAAFSLIAGYGFPEAAANPSLQKLISALAFPVGLTLVVVLGAELFTGNNALLVPAFIKGHYGAGTVLLNWVTVWLGNFAGTLLFVALFIGAAGIFDAEPYRTSAAAIADAKVAMPWLTVFVRGIGANWCVCLAIWLAMSGHTLLEKMAGCWLPVMAFIVLGFEHSVANMFFIPAGMVCGASASVGAMLWNNILPATLGNIIGGALFVGCVNTYLHLSHR